MAASARSSRWKAFSAAPALTVASATDARASSAATTPARKRAGIKDLPRTSALMTGAPLPKFVTHCSILRYEVRKQRGTGGRLETRKRSMTRQELGVLASDCESSRGVQG